MTRGIKKRLVIANWKMYIETPKEAKAYARALRRSARAYPGVDVVLAPAFPLIPSVADSLKRATITVGAQTISENEKGAHTGEVSAAMLKAFGVSLVIVGHSERRAAGETNEQIRGQLSRAQDAGIRAVLCVGERERSSSGDYFEVLKEQLVSALSGFPKGAAAKLVIAYEPVWAIGKTAADAMKPSELRETVIFIRKTVAGILGREALSRVAILYGGSVEGENTRALIAQGDVSGFLVGHASGNLGSFMEILKACAK